MREIGNIHTGGSIELERIQEFWMEQRFNEHAKAYIRAGIRDTGLLEQIDEDSSMYVYADTESGREILFYGSIQTVSVLCSCGAYSEVEIRLVSGTIRLDGAKKSRSFQNVKMTYEQVARQVIRKEPKSEIIWNLATTPKLNGPLIQYHETDWEFLKRLASHLKVKILADISSDGAWVYFGCPKRGTGHEIQCLSWKAGISEEFFSYTGRSQQDFAYCTIESEENLEIGLEIRFAGRSMTIFQKRAYTQGNCLIYCYDAGGKAFFETEKLFNDNLIGRVITGKVLSTKNETIRMQMDIDTEQDEATAYDFQWCPETGNLMYCMPQVGTTVSLYFGDSDESSASAINSVRTNGESCAEMEDPENKTLTTEYDKCILMNRTNLGLYSIFPNQEPTCCCMEDNKGVRFQSDYAFSILAGGEITIDAQNVRVEAPVSISGLIPGWTGEQSSVVLQLETDINICSENNVCCRMHCMYIYPNIQDAPRTYKNDHLLGKIILGVFAAVAVAFIAAALITMGAAVVAAAASVTFAYGSIFISTFASAAVAGSIAVGIKGAAEGLSGNVSDYGDYMAAGASVAFETAVLKAAFAPFEGVKLFTWLEKYGFKPKTIVILSDYTMEAIESVSGFCLDELLDGKPEDREPEEVAEDLGLTVVFDLISKGVTDLSVSRLMKQLDIEWRLKELSDAASGPNATQKDINDLVKYLQDNRTFLYGEISEETYNTLNALVNNDIIQGAEQNLIGEILNIPRNYGKGYYTTDGTNTEAEDIEIEEKRREYEELQSEREQEDKEYYVVRGARLTCTCGSHARRLDLNMDLGYYRDASGYKYPYVCQHQCRAGEEENIKNFGVCSGTIEGESVTLYKDESMPNNGRKEYVTGTGCIPDILGDVWLDTQTNCCVGDEEELVVGRSFLACSHGGFIEIQSSGSEYNGDLDDDEIRPVDHSSMQDELHEGAE